MFFSQNSLPFEHCMRATYVFLQLSCINHFEVNAFNLICSRERGVCYLVIKKCHLLLYYQIFIIFTQFPTLVLWHYPPFKCESTDSKNKYILVKPVNIALDMFYSLGTGRKKPLIGWAIMTYRHCWAFTRLRVVMRIFKMAAITANLAKVNSLRYSNSQVI